ncbi:MAG: hypothetical protein F6K39_42315 [Okeania sp. SIO3B3]|nr:hypothetical protein [Okeania sp. SIO3B3]
MGNIFIFALHKCPWDFNSFVEVEWASQWNGHLSGMGILPVVDEWASCPLLMNGHLARLYFPVSDIFTPWQGQAGCLPPLTTYIPIRP